MWLEDERRVFLRREVAEDVEDVERGRFGVEQVRKVPRQIRAESHSEPETRLLDADADPERVFARKGKREEPLSAEHRA